VKWVRIAQLRFSGITSIDVLVDEDTAIMEVQRLCADIEGAGLQCEVRAGEDRSLLIFVRAPPELLNIEIHKSRYDYDFFFLEL
jgi:hypothetical protein